MLYITFQSRIADFELRKICVRFLQKGKNKTPQVVDLQHLAESQMRYLAESNCSTRFCRPLPNRSAKVPCCLFAGAKVQQKFELTKYFCYFFHFFIVNARNHPLLTDNPVRVCSSYRDTSDGCCRVGLCCTSTHQHAHSAGDPCNSWGLASPSLPNR